MKIENICAIGLAIARLANGNLEIFSLMMASRSKLKTPVD